MFELTEGRKASLKSFFTNAGTVALAGLIVGSIARKEGFALSWFIAGCIVYLLMLIGCWMLDPPKKEGTDAV